MEYILSHNTCTQNYFYKYNLGCPGSLGHVWCRQPEALTAAVHQVENGKVTDEKSPEKPAKHSGAPGHHVCVYSTQTTNPHSQPEQVVFLFKFNATFSHKNHLNQEESDCLFCFSPEASFSMPTTWRSHTSQDQSVIWCVYINYKIQGPSTAPKTATVTKFIWSLLQIHIWLIICVFFSQISVRVTEKIT